MTKNLTPGLYNLPVIKNTPISYNTYLMELEAPDLAPHIKPGQFAMVYTSNPATLLPRPISIADASDTTITFVYQVVGSGTTEMTRLQQGNTAKILAPLGKGFFLKGGETKIRSQQNKVAIVGGGIGIAPLLLLAKKLKAQGSIVEGYFGFRDTPIMQDLFEPLLDRIYIATEVGHTGHRGNVVDILYALNPTYDEVLACGPKPMLDALHIYTATKFIPTQVSMEERMACGLGTCVGCALKVAGTNIRICTEGPVFYSDQLTQ